MSRITTRIDLKPSLIGVSTYLIVNEYRGKNSDEKLAYIQASLHADEIPGMVLTHHLLQILDKASLEGRIENSIKIVSFANPIGLSQVILGSHIGRFSIDSGINFNREWPNVTQTVISNIQPHLIKGDSNHNVKLIRKTILEVLETEYNANRLDKALKKELYKMASVADIVLDLHCDNDAVMHLYTHDRLWPQIADLAAELTAQCTLLAAYSGGEPCDEACSALWAAIADAYPEYAIPMACEAVTVELRGETDVSDELARVDAFAILRFLARRGFVSLDEDLTPLPPLLRTASPLSGVDMIQAPICGIIIWKTELGQDILDGQLIAEIINVEDPTCPRVQLRSRTAGVLFGRSLRHLVSAGQTVAKVSGMVPLSWRTMGSLLTA